MGAPPGTKNAQSRTASASGGDPEAECVETREGHAARADLCGEDEVAEAGLRRGGQDEEEHQRAVHGDQGEVLFGQDGAVEREAPVGPDEMDAHQPGEEGSGDDGDRGEDEIVEADVAVVGARRWRGPIDEHALASCARSERARSSLGLGLLRQLLLMEPLIELCGGKDAERGLHAVVAEAADLGAEDGVVAGSCGVKWMCCVSPGMAFCFRRISGMANPWMTSTARRVRSTSRLAGRTSCGRTMSSAPCGSVGSRPRGLPSAAETSSLRVRPKVGVGAGVAEVPGELHAGDFDLQGGGRGSGVTLGGPERVGADSEQEEKRREGDEWKVLKRELMDWAVCAAVRDYADDKQNVREGEEAEGNPEIEEEVCVESAAVPGAVHGQVPEAKSWRDRLRGGHEVIVVCGES